MGINKRALERDRIVRDLLPETHLVKLAWRRDGDSLLLNFFDSKTGAPLTRERRIQDPQKLIDLVSRTLDPPEFGPRGILFKRAVEEGRGELLIEITPTQFRKLRG